MRFVARDNREWKKEKAKPSAINYTTTRRDVDPRKVDLLVDASRGHENTGLSFRRFETRNFWLRKDDEGENTR